MKLRWKQRNSKNCLEIRQIEYCFLTKNVLAKSGQWKKSYGSDLTENQEKELVLKN